MFSMFAIEHGLLIVPTARIIAILDTDRGCIVQYDSGHDVQASLVNGTANENLARIIEEETQRILAQQRQQQAQQRMNSGLPPIAINRGKPR